MKASITTFIVNLLLILCVQLHAQIPGGVATTIYTPMGQPVFAVVNPEDDYYRDYVNNDNATKIAANNWWVQVESGATTKSQCHGWAWSQYNGGPAVEINGDVRKYFINDAVEQIAPLTQETWEEGVMIVFGANMDVPVHTAITTSEYGIVRSKWWYGAVYRHTLEGHPWANAVWQRGWYRVNMNGNRRVCAYGSTSNYSTTSSIPGASYSWKLSGAAVGGNSSSVAVQHNFSPNTVKSLSVEIHCPLSGTTIKSFRRICFGEISGYVPGGSYYIMGSSNNSSLCPNTNYTLYVNPPCSASGYTYTVPSGFTINSASDFSMSFNTGSGGSGSIEVRANVWCSVNANTCCAPAPGANVVIAYAYVDTSNPYCGWSMTVSPNPAADYVEIETGSQESREAARNRLSAMPASSEDVGEWYRLTIYNSQQVPVFTTKSSDRNVRVNTHQLQNGIYIAEIIRGKERFSKRFAVNH
jgi:hypothetical protein